MPNGYSSIRAFVRHHYRHFNAATVVDAAEGWVTHLDEGGKMFLTLAGAMSTAELGLSLAELIRAGKVHAICCTGANLEEDIYNLVAHEHYRRIPNWRALSAEGRGRAGGQGPEPRDGHLHSRGGGHAPYRGRRARFVAGGGSRRGAPLSASGVLPDVAARHAERRLPDRPRGQLDAGGGRG